MIGVFPGVYKNDAELFSSDVWTPILAGALLILMVIGALIYNANGSLKSSILERIQSVRLSASPQQPFGLPAIWLDRTDTFGDRLFATFKKRQDVLAGSP